MMFHMCTWFQPPDSTSSSWDHCVWVKAMKKKQSAADKKNRAKDSYYTALHSHMNAVNNMNVRFTFLAGGLFALQTAQREIKNCTLSPR